MPKKRIRAAGYPRCSDENLKDSPTLESQAKAIREHCGKEGYELTEDHMYPEAMTAYLVNYTERPQLMKLLAAAKRKEFDVLVVTEIRAISRKQVEVFVIYDLLQKYGVRIETVQEKFEDSAIGRFILATRAMVAELERENTYMRCQRGKRDRIENGHLPGHAKATYGYAFIDYEKEIKARYVLNETVIYVDQTGEEWTEVKVVRFIFDLAKDGATIRSTAIILNKLGIPTPDKPKKGEVAYWQTGTVYKILTSRDYIGEAYANKYKKDGKKMVRQPLEKQKRLPDGVIPPIIEKAVFDAVQEQLTVNKQEAARNNKHPNDMGILRAGHVFCGICGRRMFVRYQVSTRNKQRCHDYCCYRRTGKEELLCNHFVSIAMHILDAAAWEKVLEIIRNPALVREHVAKLRAENAPKMSTEDVEAVVSSIRKKMRNLYQLAQNATDDETIDTLGGMLKQLEKQKHDAEAMLFSIEEDAEERELIEAEIVKFEQWVEKVRPLLTDQTYTPTYEEQRLAVRIIGIRATVFPDHGDHPFRKRIDVAPPAVMAHLTKYCVSNDL